MGLAIDQNDNKLVDSLAVSLNPIQKQIVALWQEINTKPQLLTHARLLQHTAPYTAAIIVTGMQHLAKLDVQQAKQIWPQLFKQYHFTPEQQGIVLRSLALNSAMAADPQALQLLAAVPIPQVDTTVQEWRIRAALQQQNWSAVTANIAALPPAQRNLPSWRYWQARAAEINGQKEQAKRQYQQLAILTNYYGFLASERLGTAYSLPNKRVNITKADLAATVKLLTAKIGWTYIRIQDLFDVATNLHFGSQYLQQLAKNYQSNLILASAAYNAGPGRVRHWLHQRPNLASDIWVDTIPWHETRDYVKNVLAYIIIYESNLGMTPGPQKPVLGLLN